MLKLYLDENIPLSVAHGLKLRGYDVLTTHEAGNSGKTDEEQLIFATRMGRVIVTLNIRDFSRLHVKYLNTNKFHGGIILCRQKPVGVIIRGLINILLTVTEEGVKNNLIWLSNYL